MIDPVRVSFAGRGEVEYLRSFYRVCCRASYVFQLGDWRRRWREAASRNDFAMLDRLDREYEMFGVR